MSYNTPTTQAQSAAANPGLVQIALHPSPEKSPAQRAAALLQGPYSCFVPSGDVLIARRTDVTVRTPALFEQAIAQGRLRRMLRAEGDLPEAVAEKARLSDGTAIVQFPAAVTPDRAAQIVETLLGIDGVQRVRIVFAST